MPGVGCAKVVLSAYPICRGFVPQLPSNASTSPFSPIRGEKVADRPDEKVIQGRPRARKSPSPCPLPQIVCGDAASFGWLQPRKRIGGEGTLSGRPDGTNPAQTPSHQIQHFCAAQARRDSTASQHPNTRRPFAGTRDNHCRIWREQLR